MLLLACGCRVPRSVGLALAGVSPVLAVVTALMLVNVRISSAEPPLWSMPRLF